MVPPQDDRFVRFVTSTEQEPACAKNAVVPATKCSGAFERAVQLDLHRMKGKAGVHDRREVGSIVDVEHRRLGGASIGVAEWASKGVAVFGLASQRGADFLDAAIAFGGPAPPRWGVRALRLAAQSLCDKLCPLFRRRCTKLGLPGRQGPCLHDATKKQPRSPTSSDEPPCLPSTTLSPSDVRPQTGATPAFQRTDRPVPVFVAFFVRHLWT